MVEFHIVEAHPESAWVLQALHELEAAVSLEIFGEDQSTPTERLAAFFENEHAGRRGVLLALAGPAPRTGEPGRFGLPRTPNDPAEVLGTSMFVLPLADNRHLVDNVFVRVAAEHRRHGVGSALVRTLAHIGARSDRSTVLGWSEHLIGPDSAAGEQLRSPSSSATVPLDGSSRFALANRFVLCQIERQSRLDLPVDPALLAELTAQAAAAASPGYRLVSWVGPSPAEYLDHLALLNQVVSADAPIGELSVETERWDAERVRIGDAARARVGKTFCTLAVTKDTGAPAGMTDLFVGHQTSQRAEQDTTVVLADHRGHRLGLWLKAANLAQFAESSPQTRHIDTWNADENDHMLAINTMLGFRPYAAIGAWQLPIRPEAAHTGSSPEAG